MAYPPVVVVANLINIREFAIRKKLERSARALNFFIYKTRQLFTKNGFKNVYNIDNRLMIRNKLLRSI